MKENDLFEQFFALKREILKIGYICKGSIVPLYRKCGKPNCHCAKDESAKHGPYFVWTRKEKGKTVTKALSKKQMKLCEEYIQNHKKLEKIIVQMRNISSEILDRQK